MKYPTTNGRPWDSMRKKRFDYYRNIFSETIRMTNDGCGLTKDQMRIIAWNMAFQVVTDK